MTGIAEKPLVLAFLVSLCCPPISAQADQLLPEIDACLSRNVCIASRIIPIT